MKKGDLLESLRPLMSQFLMESFPNPTDYTGIRIRKKPWFIFGEIPSKVSENIIVQKLVNVF